MLAPSERKAYSDGWKDAAARIDFDAVIDSGDVQTAVDALAHRCVGIADTTKAEIARVIVRGAQDQLTDAEIARDLEQLGFDRAKERAPLIVRTELATASVTAAVDAYQASGVVGSVSWLTTALTHAPSVKTAMGRNMTLRVPCRICLPILRAFAIGHPSWLRRRYVQRSYTSGGIGPNIRFGKANNGPALRVHKSVTFPIFDLLLWPAMPVDAIGFDDEHRGGNGEIGKVAANSVFALNGDSRVGQRSRKHDFDLRFFAVCTPPEHISTGPRTRSELGKPGNGHHLGHTADFTDPGMARLRLCRISTGISNSIYDQGAPAGRRNAGRSAAGTFALQPYRRTGTKATATLGEGRRGTE